MQNLGLFTCYAVAWTGGRGAYLSKVEVEVGRSTAAANKRTPSTIQVFANPECSLSQNEELAANWVLLQQPRGNAQRGTSSTNPILPTSHIPHQPQQHANHPAALSNPHTPPNHTTQSPLPTPPLHHPTRSPTLIPTIPSPRVPSTPPNPPDLQTPPPPLTNLFLLPQHPWRFELS